MKLLTTSTANIVEGKVETENGTVVVKRYVRGSYLGKGGFAKCYEFKDFDSGQVFAAKIIDKRRAKEKLISEINIHKYLEHPGIVRFENSFEDSENIYIILELCKNQTLKELVKRRKRLTELEAQCYLGQLLPTLTYLHNCNIIHRDLKLSNLFLARGLELKVGDFGLAAELSTRGERRNTVCGTPNYVAPEILKQKSRGGHSFEVDVWAVGIILYIMLVGRAPFESPNVSTTYRRIERNSYAIPESLKLSTEAVELIKRILVPFPEKRPSLEEILRDPFMTKNAYPKMMPLLTLFSPPTKEFLSKYCDPTMNLSLKLKRSNTWCLHKTTKVERNKLKTRTCIDFLSTLRRKTLPSSIIASINEEEAITANNLKKAFEPIFIDFYVDLISRYGVGYAFTNGSLGFFFNDSTTLLTTQENKYTYYRKGDGKGLSYRECSKELKKKHMVLLFFIHWYKNIKSHAKLKCKQSKEDIIVKRTVQTSKGLLFKLSNKSIQMCFNDMTKLVICCKRILYANQKGEREMHEMNKRESWGKGLAEKLDYVVSTVKAMNCMHRHKAKLLRRLKISYLSVH
eukprot:TRINITY_DN6082_c0_g1_i1.p1 TRINITY_DN6082_c0_g1~~TRINITY_DN6082_c0_g1_i1.p1  ORF type:complete len:571 (-),score=100.43 TRINITY_DN6082_c0_g1_i1:157-1869(-)